MRVKDLIAELKTLDEQMDGPFGLLRMKLSREPSVRGNK